MKKSEAYLSKMMWSVGLLMLAVRLTSAQDGTTDEAARFEWQWKKPDLNSGGATSGQYFVRTPQSEQRVAYTADHSGYHPAVMVNASDDSHQHEVAFAIGDQALKLLGEQGFQFPEPLSDVPQAQRRSAQQPELFLQQTQFPYPLLPNAQFLFNNFGGIPSYQTSKDSSNTPTYYVVPEPTNVLEAKKPESSIHLQNIEEVNTERSAKGPVVTVFDTTNCTEGHDNQPTAKNTTPKTTKTTPETYWTKSPKNINGNFGVKLASSRPTFTRTVHYSIKEPADRKNSRSERILFTEMPKHVTQKIAHDDEGISKLVASTQDLISNEDLLRINHAFEKNIYQNDDVIKPANTDKPSQYTRFDYIEPAQQQQFQVRAKVQNVIITNQELQENKEEQDNIVQNESNNHNFATPIIVQDSTITDVKEQVVNNIVSTVAPYLKEGYEVASIKNTIVDGINKFTGMVSDDTYNVTPRPIGQNYLAPITVGLRLVNANETEFLNTLDEDHEGSDTELVSERVKSPVREKTIVEIQESIPLETIHINDVEVHTHYLEDGKSLDQNNESESASSLFDRYMDALQSSKKIQQNMNENLYKYGTLHGAVDYDNDNKDQSVDNVEASANVQTEIEVKPEQSDTNQRSELIRLNVNDYGNNKIIQPIVIEKEVPVTKFIDRYIEKPYPERVEVIKDNHIVIPVPVEKIVEKPYEVTRYIDKPYAVQVPQPYPVEIKVPYPIEKQIFVDRPVHVPYPVDRVVEKEVIKHVAVPTAIPIPVQVPVEKQVLYPIPVEKRVPVPVEVEKKVPYETVVEKQIPVPYAVEKRVPYPVPYEKKVPVPYPVTVEKHVPVPVEKIVEKPVTVTKVVEKPVRVEVPVPQPYAVPQPYPVERIVEKKVPYPVHVDRVVEKRVPFQVPYPVEKIVEKIVEKPVVVTKYVDKPYPVETKVPYPVERIVEKKVPYAVKVPVEVRVPYPVQTIVEKPVHVPVKVPYPVERLIPVFYSSKNVHRSEQPKPLLDNVYAEKYQQYLRSKEIEQQNIKLKQTQQQYSKNSEPERPTQTTYWGKVFIRSGIDTKMNLTEPQTNEFHRTPLLTKYLNFLTNEKSNIPYHYYGPPPAEGAVDMWARSSGNTKRRTDREPKLVNLRIEYGFKPPLVPSTEVDLDGIPVEKTKQI